MKLPIPKLGAIPGLPLQQNWYLYAAWGYSVVGFYAFLRARKYNKQQKENERLSFIRHAGHYKHPWNSSSQRYNTNVLDRLKGVDYNAMVQRV